jgi:hypothetical protein
LVPGSLFLINGLIKFGIMKTNPVKPVDPKPIDPKPDPDNKPVEK